MTEQHHITVKRKTSTAQASSSIRAARTIQSVTPAAKTKAARAAAKPTTKRSASPLDKTLRQWRRKLDKTTAHLSKHGRKFITNRWDHIRMARRDVVVWLVLMLLLISGGLVQTIWYNQQATTTAATAGGIYAEGVVDKLTTVDPLYANTDTEKAASQLVYPGLLSYDSANKLNGDLAASWTHDQNGQVWTVKLKSALQWSDGQPVTARDVVATVDLMKNKEINSNLASSWETISANAIDNQTVEFKLASPLATFDSALTFGVLPSHILKDKSVYDIASLSSKNPAAIVGSGPFTVGKIDDQDDNKTWHFQPNNRYYGNHVQINELTIRTYSTDADLANGLKRGEVNAISGVKVGDIKQFSHDQFKTIQLKTAGGVYALFNCDGELTGDATIRNALRLGLDRPAVRRSIAESNNELHSPADLESPLATGIFSSVDQIRQPDYNVNQAKQLLDQAGWTLTDGAKYRTKGDQTLTINLVTIAGTNYENVAKTIAKQWQSIGVDAKVQSVNPAQAQQNYLAPRNYDVLVYQLQLGADPDVFAYWSSTQTGQTGLNLANYTSRRAEIPLSSARTITDPRTREDRYTAFVNQWIKDNPAIALYQPSLFYVMDKDLDTLHDGDALISAANRFRGVSTWTVSTSPVMVTP